jgi:hypothetical protein
VLIACVAALVAAASLTITIVTPPPPTPAAPAVDELRAAADLASVTAFSNTLAAQANQVDRLVDVTIDQVTTWQALAVMLAAVVALIVVALIVAALIVAVAMARRRPAAPVYYVVQPPAHQAISTPTASMILDDPEQWPELRARRRALAELAPPREEMTP